MSPALQNTTELFSVFGTAYAPQQHLQSYGKDVAPAARQTNPAMFEKATTGFFTVILETLYASRKQEMERAISIVTRLASTH